MYVRANIVVDLHIILVCFLHLTRLDGLISSQCYEEAVCFAVEHNLDTKVSTYVCMSLISAP